MPGLRLLSPAPIDGNARLMERLMDLENRLAALESKRDLIITPFNTTGASISYTWTGGRLWIVAGGYVTSPGSGISGTSGYTLATTGNSFTNAINHVAITGALTFPVGTIVREFALAGVVPGTLTITAAAYGDAAAINPQGMLLEWPQ